MVFCFANRSFLRYFFGYNITGYQYKNITRYQYKLCVRRRSDREFLLCQSGDRVSPSAFLPSRVPGRSGDRVRDRRIWPPETDTERNRKSLYNNRPFVVRNRIDRYPARWGQLKSETAVDISE